MKLEEEPLTDDRLPTDPGARLALLRANEAELPFETHPRAGDA